MSLSKPLNALLVGERAVATITASGIVIPSAHTKQLLAKFGHRLPGRSGRQAPAPHDPHHMCRATGGDGSDEDVPGTDAICTAMCAAAEDAEPGATRAGRRGRRTAPRSACVSRRTEPESRLNEIRN